MITPENTDGDLQALIRALSAYKSEAKEGKAFSVIPHERGMSIREAIFAPTESIPVCQAEGRICALPTVSCPPAVPIVVSGEIITKADVEMLLYYGTEQIQVVKAN
jgi:arginine/lysine/ornithine decarboxylase